MQGKSFNSGERAPEPELFPSYPASWYLFGPSEELNRHPVSKAMLGSRLVGFRTTSGKVAVMNARCAHLGADLGRGQVVGETVQCPFHGWRYSTDGVCTHIPCSPEVPPFARLQTYPVQERHGYVFIFNGAMPLFPLPFFIGLNPEEFAAGRVFEYVADCTWYMNAAHAFDTQHFASVHDRRLLAPPAIDCPEPYARRNSYRAEVVGHSIFDRLLRSLAGHKVAATLTIWGGNFAGVTADFGGVQSRFLITMHPLEGEQTLCQGIVFVPRRRKFLSLPKRTDLWARRVFTRGYLAEEARRLRGPRYNPHSLGPMDRDMISFFQWVVSLPQGPSTSTGRKVSESKHESLSGCPDVCLDGDTGGAVAASVSGTE